MKKVSLILASIAIISAITLNILSIDSNTKSLSLNNLFQKAIAYGEGEFYLAWSNSKNCYFTLPGTYHECEYLGPQNPCDEEGDTTCTCGENCD